MAIPLFHETNTFSVYKKNEDQKTINFTGHKVGLYYKLYSILRKKHNYHTHTATVRDITGRVLMNGNFMDIFTCLICELKKEHKYAIVSYNSDGLEVHHWCDNEERLVEQLKFLQEKFTRSGDPRLFKRIQVLNNETNEIVYDKLEVLIEQFSKQAEEEEKEAEFGVYLSFEEVLNDMRPLIMNGTDKEKIEAKAILAYVATKLAGK